MKCIFCDLKDYYVMKIPCNHFICINCFKKETNCKVCSKNFKYDNNQEEEIPNYCNIYDYDNNKI